MGLFDIPSFLSSLHLPTVITPLHRSQVRRVLIQCIQPLLEGSLQLNKRCLQLLRETRYTETVGLSPFTFSEPLGTRVASCSAYNPNPPPFCSSPAPVPKRRQTILSFPTTTTLQHRRLHSNKRSLPMSSDPPPTKKRQRLLTPTVPTSLRRTLRSSQRSIYDFLSQSTTSEFSNSHSSSDSGRLSL